MEAEVYSPAGEVVGQVELDDTVWAIEPNVAIMHQALVRQQANARLGTHNTKTRGQVSGGGRKPWRQKGTGRARQGSIRAPQWKGGGVVWGPHPRKYTQDMPRKMRRLAVRSALSAKVLDDRLVVMRGLTEIEPKTKAMKAVLAALPAGRSTLIAVPGKEGTEAIYRGASNLPNVKVLPAMLLNMHDLLKYERLVVLEESLPIIEQWLALPAERRVTGPFRQERLARLNQRQRPVLARIAARGNTTEEVA
jgi:large subunit ribosomal protein L4